MTDWVRKGIEKARQQAEIARIKKAREEGDMRLDQEESNALFEQLTDLAAQIIAEYCRELGASAATLHNPRSRQFSVERAGHSIQLILDGSNIQILVNSLADADHSRAPKAPALSIIPYDGTASFTVDGEPTTVDEVARILLQPLLFD